MTISYCFILLLLSTVIHGDYSQIKSNSENLHYKNGIDQNRDHIRYRLANIERDRKEVLVGNQREEKLTVTETNNFVGTDGKTNEVVLVGDGNGFRPKIQMETSKPARPFLKIGSDAINSLGGGGLG